MFSSIDGLEIVFEKNRINMRSSLLSKKIICDTIKEKILLGGI
jgi:hypothetical protein